MPQAIVAGQKNPIRINDVAIATVYGIFQFFHIAIIRKNQGATDWWRTGVAMAREFETFRRKNYEAWATFSWLVIVAYSLMAMAITGLPPFPFLVAAGTAAVMTLVRGIPAIRFYFERKRLVSPSGPDYMTLKELEERNDQENIYFGKGFTWSQPHTQKVFDILKGSIEEVAPRTTDQMGAYWVHGIGAGADRDILFPIQHSEGHTFIVGTTGSGKTTLFRLLIAQAILRNETVLIFDPKGDEGMRRIAEGCCRHIGRPDRFVYFHPAFPQESASIDAMHNFNRASELASRLAALIPSETGSDPFKAFSQKALDNITQALLTMDSKPSLVSLRRYLEGGAANLVIKALGAHLDRVSPEWRDRINLNKNTDSVAAEMIRYYRERVQEKHPALALEGMMSLYEHDRTHFNKMVASLLPVMNMLTTGEMAGLLSPLPGSKETTSLLEIIQKNQVAYIALDSLPDAMTGAAIGSLLLSDLASVAGNRYNYGVGSRKINIFVDEAAEVVNDPFIQLLNKGRGAGIRLFVATQTFSDFVARMGSRDKAQQILGNMNNLISLRVLDGDTQKFVTGNLPKTYIKYIMQVQGSSTNSEDPAIFSGSVSERLMEEEVDLVPPQILGMLPNFHYFAKLSGGRIVKGWLPILMEGENGRKSA